jgi:flagellin
MSVINTNVKALVSQESMRTSNLSLSQAMERLSTGSKINSAKDDAAGLGIANSLTQQINGANQGVRNLNDGISMVQTAEGAIGAAQEMAQRILTLATQGANGILGDNDRKSIRQEMRQLMAGIESIATRTKFSSNSLLAGSAVTLQVSNVTTDTITLGATAFTNIGTGISTGAVSDNTAYSAGNFTGTGAAKTLISKINLHVDSALVSGDFTDIQTEADLYIKALSTQRGLLGAYQNQIEFTVSNTTELASNLSAARSSVQDTDYASETASLTKGQILQQAATAMLAQANQMPNVILSLLK